MFAGRGGGHFNGFSEGKKAFDEKLPDSALDDSRFTPDCSVAHVPRRRASRYCRARTWSRSKAFEGIYDRHRYREEKAHALAALAGLIGDPVAAVREVLPMRGTGDGGRSTHTQGVGAFRPVAPRGSQGRAANRHGRWQVYSLEADALRVRADPEFIRRPQPLFADFLAGRPALTRCRGNASTTLPSCLVSGC